MNESQNPVDTTGISIVKIFTPTMSLRMLKTESSIDFLLSKPEAKLQQAWHCAITGCTEWRDIPLVVE